ncbi:MAG: DUF4861 family protein, partial [Aeriscardovia sp.]|nr:DUF4861 family protein [Aeriscardovia sp.]
RILSQISYDKKLLFEATVQPHGKGVFTIAIGEPLLEPVYVKGFIAKTRKDDLAWENDRTAYRVYGPPLRATGEKAYGVDVWTKSTPRLVMAERFKVDYEGNIVKDSLSRAGDKEGWNRVNMATSFHLNHGDGMDGYGVGPSLGCGAPALYHNGELLMPWCYESVKILDNGPLRFTAEFVFGSAPIPETWNLKTETLRQHRIISLDKGSNFNRCEVWYEGLDDQMQLAVGVVLHKEDVSQQDLRNERVLYADPTDTPAKHNSQIFVGCLFPDEMLQTKSLVLPKPQGSIAGHAIGIRDYQPSQHFTYYFGSAWSSADVHSFREWQVRADEYLKALKAPVKVVLTPID